ncbi:hypothetical protein GCM10008955_31490 [Deinococcus malanensis]|uniref:Uncharacterized protein n=1 Tax=Deinococcus malanensis TaxID=1706855 RepID=A0ABQ2F2Y7_9DEIO|nr:hypothetical protein GCM10008955_31490 [Deinococcus malanensis]
MGGDQQAVLVRLEDLLSQKEISCGIFDQKQMEPLNHAIACATVARPIFIRASCIGVAAHFRLQVWSRNAELQGQ